MKILVVEDTEDSRILLERLLQSQGHTVISAISGVEALTLARREQPGLVISDILMPEMDGFDLCRRFKADPVLAAIPFIFYTATYTEKQDEELAMRLGASRFILKPAPPQELIKIIREVTDSEKGPPRRPGGNKLGALHRHVVSKKLDKKVRELGEEREKLKQSREKYQRLVESLRKNYFFYAHDTKGVFTYISRSITTVLGYSQEEFLTHYSKYLSDNPLNTKAEAYTRRGLQGEKQPPYELEIVHKNGSFRRLEVTEEPIFDRSGRVVAVEGIANDISERYEVVKILAEARDEWERTFQAIHDPILILDPQMRIVRVNRAVETLLGKPPETLENQICHHVFQDDERPCPGCPVADTLKDSHPHFGEIEHGILNKTFIGSASPNFDPDGNLLSVVYYLKDITERKQLENQLRRAQKLEALGTLAGGIAHDFNNILSAILGYSEILSMELPPDSDNQAYLRQIIAAGNRAKDLIMQVLTFSSDQQSEQKPVRVQNVLEEALKLLRPSIPATIKIRRHIDPKCRMVLADPSQIHQLIMNLCTNSYHALRETGGLLDLSLHQVHLGPEGCRADSNLQPGEFMRLEVSDTGCGMDNATRDRIFDPYFSTKKKGEGTGLGLSVVLGIIKSLEGHIAVHSEPNLGTTVEVYLPIIQARSGPQ